MTFTPMPYRLSPELVAAREQKRQEKLHQSFDDTVNEVRLERQAATRRQLRRGFRAGSSERTLGR